MKILPQNNLRSDTVNKQCRKTKTKQKEEANHSHVTTTKYEILDQSIVVL